jgi:hypothetical protein
LIRVPDDQAGPFGNGGGQKIETGTEAGEHFLPSVQRSEIENERSFRTDFPV